MQTAAIHRPQRSVSCSLSSSHFLLHDLQKRTENTRRKTKKKKKRMHAECKKRSLVVNLTHEITGTDVADQRNLLRLNYLFFYSLLLKRFLIDYIAQSHL
jgi:hypothetical protein